MGYPLRDQQPNTVYAVASAGVDGMPIFRCDHDVALFVALLADVAARCGWRVHELRLADNSYELVVETRSANLAQGMQLLNGIYARAFNRRHRRFGHLFARRYESRRIGRGGRLRAIARRLLRRRRMKLAVAVLPPLRTFTIAGAASVPKRH